MYIHTVHISNDMQNISEKHNEKKYLIIFLQVKKLLSTWFTHVTVGA